MSALERDPQIRHRLHTRSWRLHRRERNPERPPSNSHGDWPFLRPPERVPEVPVVSREHLPQLEKIQEVLPFRGDEAHFRCGVTRLITPKLWNFQRVLQPLLQLKKFPHIPVSTREEARESRPHPEEPRFRLLDREEGSFPCMVGKELPAFLSHLKRRRSPQERREELQGRATIPTVPQMSQSIPGKPVFPALPRLSSQGSTHTPVARRTALWESLVGKPRGKAPDPLNHGKGSATLLLQLGRKAHVAAPTRNED